MNNEDYVCEEEEKNEKVEKNSRMLSRQNYVCVWGNIFIYSIIPLMEDILRTSKLF